MCARPKGSKNKPKVSPLVKENKEAAVESAFAKNRREVNGIVEDIMDKGFAITPNKGILAIDTDKFEPMPANWFSMSRVEQMRWLQENRK